VEQNGFNSVGADRILQPELIDEALLHACRIGQIRDASKFTFSNFTEITMVLTKIKTTIK
jgi:hypothetical protein